VSRGGAAVACLVAGIVCPQRGGSVPVLCLCVDVGVFTRQLACLEMAGAALMRGVARAFAR
jgi:hypothetical protein